MSERLNQPEQPRLTDDDLIDQAIQRARERESVIDDAAARVIAAQLHGGQASALYSLASSGAIDREGLEVELRLDAREFKHDPRVLGQLEALSAYIDNRGVDVEPRAGWHELWVKEETKIAGLTPDEWHRTLAGADLAVPCSRYGRTASEVARYAVALLAIYQASGAEPAEAESIIDFAMGLAVNDHQDIAAMICDYWDDVPEELQEQLGGRDRVEELRDE
ncbi:MULTISPECIES: hypothetical protein [Arthrobacter]|uniref:Uncharacterized protein n=1 Tax=Arthrobacter terricola TaxID=2547396 RepID=A0A4R5KJK7_9MICC|nr:MULTISPECIES: hypothetical protein [Arthrobacter]MBT8161445.1 hypothetical protein [Arthrobacter sp. GN70]TDF95616.1 hypothetical protein E1809_11355 [Arthrobacter terricola]